MKYENIKILSITFLVVWAIIGLGFLLRPAAPQTNAPDKKIVTLGRYYIDSEAPITEDWTAELSKYESYQVESWTCSAASGSTPGIHTAFYFCTFRLIHASNGQ